MKVFVPYPNSNALFTTQDTNGICLNMGAIDMAPTYAVLWHFMENIN